MGLFDKVAKTATNMGKSALNTASNVGSTVGVAAQDQSELASLKMQVNVIEQELDSSFCQRQFEIVRKRRRNFVVFRRGGG